MAALTADFETGTNTNTIATGDTGSATALSTVNGTPVYSNAHPAHGSLGAFFNYASAEKDLGWSALFTLTEEFGRLYFYQTAKAASNDFPMVRYRNGGTDAFIIVGQNGGPIQVKNGGTLLGSFTTNPSTNTLYRLEWHCIYSTGGAGSMVVSLYTGDSTSVTETKTFTSLTTQAQVSVCQFGVVSGSAGTWALYLDQLVAGGSAAIGPFPVNTVAPAVTGSAPVGSILTCDGGTWGGTFTLTYQWTRAGSNIAAATASTYTTVSADAGNAIGCKVTATGVQATNENATQASSNTITATAVSGVSLLGSPPTDFFFFP